MTETAACPFCESEIPTSAKKCRHCGEWVSRDCQACGTPIKGQWAARGFCADCESKTTTGFSLQSSPGSPQVPAYYAENKSRSISIGLALVLGGIGAHKFYLDKPGKGFLYMVFCWTGIPTMIGLYEAAKYIWMNDEEFQRRFLGGEL